MKLNAPLRYSIAIWATLSFLCLVGLFAFYGGPSQPPADTPRWLLWTVNGVAAVNGAGFLAFMVYSVAEGLKGKS